MMIYYIGSIYGIGKAKVSRKSDHTYTLHIELTPKNSPKNEQVVLQSECQIEGVNNA